MNDRVHPVVDYDPDPHGGWLFSSLARSINAGINGAPAVIVRTPTYAGVVPRALQRFRGAAGMGAAQIYADRAPQMNQQQTTTDSATSAIFAARMARGL
jgi:hypothetical protein